MRSSACCRAYSTSKNINLKYNSDLDLYDFKDFDHTEPIQRQSTKICNEVLIKICEILSFSGMEFVLHL